MSGQKGSTHFTSPEVAAVNHFHNAMVGKKEYYTTGNNCFVVCREGGAVIVAAKGSNFDVTVPNGGSIVAQGSYKDEVSGGQWTVNGSSISGHIGLPSEGDGFWAKISQIGLYRYGEILDSPGGDANNVMKEYANYIGITDSDIINAVRYHTTGRANMSLLEKIIYIADYTAVGREYNGVEIMREKSRKSLEEAMIFSFQYTFNNLSSKEIAIHPDEIFAYNYIVLNKERNKP